jgi:hypothetical protein
MRHTPRRTAFKNDTGETLNTPTPWNTRLSRRDFLGAAGALALTANGPLAYAQAPFPSKPVQLIVPWPAGGQTDLTVRILAEEAEPLLGQPEIGRAHV